MVERDVPEPEGSNVVVAVEASPINPSDLGVLLGAVAPGALSRDGSDLVGAVTQAALPLYRDRLGKSLPVGNEGAALFINPLTALSMVETMRAEGHTALVHTAAASNLGQMLVRICAADGIGLVNVVRRPEQTRVLRDLGATHVVDSSQPDFAERLTEAIRETGATLSFDAIGGGSLTSEILTAMERAQPPLTSYTPYGTAVHKQGYIYGSLDFSPTVIDRRFGLTWGVGGYLLTTALARLGGEAVGRMRARVLAEARTTFATHYAHTIGLLDVLQPETLIACARRRTGSKYLINPSSDRST